MPPSCLNVETSRSTFATSARNTCNILMKHLKHIEHTLVTCTNPATRHECLLIAATACPLPRAIPLLLSVEGAARRRELRARAPPWGAARHAPDRAATKVKAGGGAKLTPRRLECLRGGEGRRHYDIPTRVRCRGGSTGSSALVTGELRVDAEGAGPQHEGPMMFFSPRRSSSGGAPPRGQIFLLGILRP
jgi:hypothetical protein